MGLNVQSVENVRELGYLIKRPSSRRAVKDRRGYCQLKEEALDRTMWMKRFGRGFGPLVWQITDDDDDDHTATCRPLFKRSVSLLKLTRQSSCGSNFDRTSTVFIWLSPVILINLGCKGFSYAVYLSVCLHRCLVAYLVNYSLAHSLEARHSFDWLAV